MQDRAAEFYHSPEQVAELYGLHVRTVRRYIREGKLNALRIGNRYRITPDDLEAFSGRAVDVTARRTARGEPQADVSSVVDLHPIEREAAERLSTLLLGAGNRRDPNDTRLRIDVIYDPSRERLKVVVVGTLAHTSAALALITTHLEQ
jgi:excisionase family DNA binding protein